MCNYAFVFNDYKGDFEIYHSEFLRDKITDGMHKAGLFVIYVAM